MTEYPLISILLALYEPNADWLKELLNSLGKQTYPNLELVILDDCSKEPIEEKIISEFIGNMPYRIYYGEKNYGSNKAFERLTLLAEGEYLAYCDQDDIWLPEKLSVLYKVICNEEAELVCSDVIVIDENGSIKADSITKKRRRHKFFSGRDLFGYLICRNFVMGCTMLVKHETAVQAVPFVKSMVHDHWIALYASSVGKISVVKKPLIKYRIHQKNQTGILKNISCKADYISERINAFQSRLLEIKERIGEHDEITSTLLWIEARKNYAEGVKGSAKNLWRLRKVNFLTTLFELIFMRMPESVFKTAVLITKKF